MNVVEYTDHIGLWERELKSWLPEKIFDGHVHLSPPGIMQPISEARLREPLLTFTSYTWEQLRDIYRLAFSGKQVVGVIGFPFPLREVDIDAANDYIIGLMSVDPSFRGFALADPVDADRTIRKAAEAEKRGVRFQGVKPYFDLLGKSNYVTTMPEFIPRAAARVHELRKPGDDAPHQQYRHGRPGGPGLRAPAVRAVPAD